tara:strand:+ start:781 stop:1098 length:318 start_codon:yes stop_codon:yes gene_type:complete
VGFAKIFKLVKIFVMSTKEKISEKLLVDEKLVSQKEIVLHNDDVNTFDHVIETLMHVCDHTPEQAEQCSLIVHYNGKCTVKTGPYKDLKPRCTLLLEAGLSAEIV